jgi:type IV secretory pathway TraG/TraD family ATPase VirD4
MGARNSGLIADPLFVGATRPPMRWGVTYSALLFNLVFTLGAIDGLKDALARLRKFGGRCVLAFQSVAQVSSTYGHGEAQTIIENCTNTLILRCAGSEHGGTSQFASRLIGEREIVRRQTSHGRDREGWFISRGLRRTTNVSEQRITEVAVMASELEQLPDLSGYLKTASSSVWLRVGFQP